MYGFITFVLSTYYFTSSEKYLYLKKFRVVVVFMFDKRVGIYMFNNREKLSTSLSNTTKHYTFRGLG